MPKASLCLQFDEAPPGLNGKDGLLRLHWTQRGDLRDRWRILVRVQLGEFMPLEPLFDKHHPCTVVATRLGKRRFDLDNFGASLKPVLDALVHWWVLADDSPNVIGRLQLQQRKAKQNGLIIELYPGGELIVEGSK